MDLKQPIKVKAQNIELAIHPKMKRKKKWTKVDSDRFHKLQPNILSANWLDYQYTEKIER